MSDKHITDEIITKFLLNTCRLRPQMTEHAVLAVIYSAHLQTQHANDDVEADVIQITTGSAAEFYIEPMLSCVADVDVMYHRNTELAIPAGQSPPTQLPDEFHSYVRLFEIIDSHWPGYVYLELRYLLTECTDGGKHNAVEYDREQYLSNKVDMPNTKFKLEIHGPALTPGREKHKIFGSLSFFLDQVHCVRCLSWPPQAADWPTRHRYYDWPDSATVSRVVGNGCDVVPVAHRQCRDDERIGSLQWRLSFSRAEVVLLNSWMPVQQIVYHVLRRFAKTEQLTHSLDNSSGPSPISNYHLKTLMLWTCEVKPLSWWTDNIGLVKTCVELLHIFADCLNAELIQQYFITYCNLLDSSYEAKTIASKLGSVDETWLSTWLVDNYIRKCAQLCPANVLRLFDNVSTNVELHNAVSAVVDWRLSRVMSGVDLHQSVIMAEVGVAEIATARALTVRSCDYMFSKLADIDARLSLYFKSVAFLHVSLNICRRRNFDGELMDVLATLVGQNCFAGRTHHYSHSADSAEACLGKAAKLMKSVASKTLSTDHLIEIELSKTYLYRALRCTDSCSDSIYYLANVYLAALYCTTGQHETATELCTLRTNEPYNSCIVQGEILPKIDDHIDIALGLGALYQYVLTTSLNQPERKKYVTVFTPELFAHYLDISCHRILTSHRFRVFAQTEFVDNIKQFQYSVRAKQQLFIADALLFKLTRWFSESNIQRESMFGKCRHNATRPTELNTSKLVDLLQKSAVEQLTNYRQLVSPVFRTVVTFVTTEFESLYEYKRGNHCRCLQLATRNVKDLVYASSMSYVLVMPLFTQLMDDDIVSLTALTLILDPDCRELNVITQLTLSLYLMAKCQSKLRQSATSLSRTLHCIEVTQRRHSIVWMLDHLTLKLTKRTAVRNLSMFFAAVGETPSHNPAARVT